MKIKCWDALERQREFELPADGKLTPELRWVLSSGHCHSFALALCEVTGWDMVGIVTKNGLQHVYVRPEPEDGLLIDAISSKRWALDLFNHPSGRGFQSLHPAYNFSRRRGWLKACEKLLIPFAEHRIEELQAEPEGTFHGCIYPFA